MNIALVVGLIFSPLAALMAFLISYIEYERHFADKRVVLAMALRSGFVALAVFLFLSVAGGMILNGALSGNGYGTGFAAAR